jgi:asparagine synthetase B (glutamine-hydrolysing)
MYISYDASGNQYHASHSLEQIYFMDDYVAIYESNNIKMKEISHTKSSISILFGEVYNGKEVITHNHYSWGGNLTASIIRPISEKNYSLLSQLNGSYCLVIYDIINQKLKIISDRYGSQRYYYGTQNGNTIISSSIWPFIQHGFELDLDNNFLIQFLSFGYIPTKQTHFRNVKLNQYGTVLTVNNSGQYINQYWHLKFNETEPVTEIDYLVKKAPNIWSKAVETSLPNTGKATILLSGGLDSRAILAAALECKQSKDIITFTGGTPGTFDYEIGRLLAKQAGVKNITMDMTSPKNYILEYRQMMQDLDGMIDVIPYFFSSDWRHIKDYSPYVLSGSCASFITGTHLSELIMETYSQNKISKRGFIDNVLYINQSVSPDHVSELLGISTQEFHQTLKDFIIYADRDNGNLWLPNRCDHWDFSSRLRNYIMSLLAPRSGLHVIKPMLVNEWVDFCTSISPELRYGSLWYRRFLVSQYPKLFSLPTKNLYGRPLKQNLLHGIVTFSENSIISLLSFLPSEISEKASPRVKRLFQARYIKYFTPDPTLCRPEKITINYMDYNYWLRGANKQWAEVVHSLIHKTIEFGLVPEQPVQNLISRQLRGDDQSGIILLYLGSLGLLLDIYQSN